MTFVDKYGVNHAYEPTGEIYYETKRTLSGSDSIRENIDTGGKELINFEMRGYFLASRAPTNSGLQCKMRGGQHYTDPDKSDEGACYAPAIKISSGTPHLRYEDGHPYYKKITVEPKKKFGKLSGKWFGFAAAIQTTAGGNVRIKTWVDPPVTTLTTPPNKWVLAMDYTDKKYKQLHKRGKTTKVTFRLDDSPLKVKYLSAHEILM